MKTTRNSATGGGGGTDATAAAVAVTVAAADKLTRSARAAESLVCVGIDPRPELIPPEFPGSRVPGTEVHDFLEAVLDVIGETGRQPAAFKPNIAYFHQIDRPRDGDFTGSTALAALLERLEREYPDVPVILDAKRGDIAGSSSAYAREAFVSWGVDAVTVSPFMGDDSVGPFLEEAAARGGWVYILNRTSNPGAHRFQQTPAPTRPLYEEVAVAIGEWQERFGSAGAVIGATALHELGTLLRLHAPHPVPVLIPGVGSQGGSAAEVLSLLQKSGYPVPLVRVNVSRDVVFPWAREQTIPADWRTRIRESYQTIHE
nr:orotidine-5'-phosphate decarboxylase [Spirochaeta sp.]